ncbi:MAG TPA: hypothetical protein VMT12_02195 [Syntrophales bacterium]|nr:hypothetical protein [Syntrophales bacterium]
MAKTLIIDLSYLLDEEGDLAQDSGLGRQLFEFFTAIVAMVSYPATEPPPEYKVRCHQSDKNGNQCPGHIVGEIVPESEDIVWHCPVCKDKGLISNWQDTLWDLSHADIEH